MPSSQFITPPRKHREATSKMTFKTHLRRNSRSPCTTSSTVFTWQSSPNSVFECPATPTRLNLSDYYNGHDEEHEDDYDAPGICFGGWILRKLFSPVSLFKTDVSSAQYSQENYKATRQSITEEAESTQKQNEMTPKRLELALNARDRDIHNDLSRSSQPASESNYAAPQNDVDLEIVQLQELLSVASKHEDDCDLNAAIIYIEDYLYKSHYLLRQTNFVFESRRAAALHKLGCIQWKCGRYQLSLFAFVEAITLYDRLIESLSGGNTPDVVSKLTLASSHTLISKGRLHLSQGEGAAAMQCYHECVHRLSSNSLESARIFSQACLGAGRVLLAQGKLKASLKRFKRALNVQLGYQGTETPVSREEIYALSFDEAHIPLPDIAETLSHLGKLYEELKNLDQAMQCYEKAFQIYSRALGPNHVDTGEVSLKLGRIQHRLGHFSEANRAFCRAHQIFVNNLGEIHRNSQAALLNLGMLYASRGQHKKALTMYHRVLQAQQTTFGGDAHPDLASTFHCIATSYEAMFNLEQAIEHYDAELRILEKTLHPYHLDIAKLLHHMAMVTMNAVDNKGNYLMSNESISWLEEAADIYRHHNQSNTFRNELICVQAFLRELRQRVT